MYIAIPTNSLNREQFEYMYSAPEYFYLFLEYRGGVHPGQVCRGANTQTQATIHTHIDIYGQELPINLSPLTTCLWTVGGIPRENQRKHGENMQNPYEEPLTRWLQLRTTPRHAPIHTNPIRVLLQSIYEPPLWSCSRPTA